MQIDISEDKQTMGRRAAAAGASFIRQALAHGPANVIVATGASQFEMLAALVTEPDIDWSKVTVFHLDEYVGMPITHPASFRRYLRERFVEKLPSVPAEFHYINGDGNCLIECIRLSELINGVAVDVAFIGIGENAHLAFNDPPAAYDGATPYLVVELDDACRQQQLGEGWFPDLAAVPRQAITMSVPQILRSKKIIATVPDVRKALAVKRSVEGPVTLDVPASFLQRHVDTTLYLDRAAASQLSI